MAERSSTAQGATPSRVAGSGSALPLDGRDHEGSRRDSTSDGASMERNGLPGSVAQATRQLHGAIDFFRFAAAFGLTLLGRAQPADKHRLDQHHLKQPERDAQEPSQSRSLPERESRLKVIPRSHDEILDSTNKKS